MAETQTKAEASATGHWLVVLRIVAALGGPAVGWAAFADSARQHPWRAAFLLILYELVVFCAQILGEIWKRLKDPWLNACAQWIDYRVQQFVSGYRKSYLQHLFYECRDFDLKGQSTQGPYALELQRVFVELAIDPLPAHEASPDPIPKLPDHLLQGRHDIWEYLAANRSLAVIGAPGSGKTTLLKHIALVLAVRNQHPKGKRAPRRLPVLLFLRSHAKAISANSDISLAEVIQSGEIVRENDAKAPPGWFERQLKLGRCLVLLDGLDEVADLAARGKVVAWVEKCIRTHPNNLFLLTSRPHGYRDNPVHGVHVLSVRPFSPDQVGEFVLNWYVANEIIAHGKDDPGVRQAAAKGARDMMSRLRSSAVLTDLAVNPLLLTMIATVHRYRSELPGRRVELYREICEVFLGKRQDVRGVDRALDLTPSQKQRVLEPLAYHLMCARTREIYAPAAADAVAPTLQRVSPQTAAADFFRMIQDSSGLLLERETGVWEFAHKTFQEYLAAVHCRTHNLQAELATRVGDDWWHEAIRLYVAEADATPILEACFQQDPPSLQALILAVECVDEAQQLDQSWRERLAQTLAGGAEDDQRSRLYAEALLTLRLRKLVAVDENRSLDTSLLTQAEYQLYLDEMRTRGVHRQPDHWTLNRFAPDEGDRPVAGVRASDAQAFCQWLSDRQGGAWTYRVPTTGELDEVQPTTPRQQSALESIGCWTLAQTGKPSIAGASTVAIEHFLSQTVRFTRTLALDLACARGRALDLARALALDLDFTLDLDLARAFDLDRARPFDLDRALYRVRALELDVAFALASALHRDLDLDLVHAFDLDLDLDRALDRDLDGAPGLTRDRALARAHALARARSAALLGAGVYMLARKRLTGDPMASAPSFYWRLRRKFRRRVSFVDRASRLEYMLDACCNLYLALVVIEGRRRGEIPVLGGIRIVRERAGQAGEPSQAAARTAGLRA